MSIAIINCGSGNLNSVYNIIDYLGYDCKITNDKSYISKSTHIIFPRVWRIKNKQWYKDNIWGDESAYGDVYLNKNEQENFNIRKKI